jgi:rhodanese-related sulfurtransferase
VTHADGHAEREAAKIMINDARQAAEDANAEITLGADKGYDAQKFIEACQEMKVTPHVAQNTSGRRSAVADAIASSLGYSISQRKRKLIEQGFAWAKTVGRMRQVMVRSEIRSSLVYRHLIAGDFRRRVSAEPVGRLAPVRRP